MHADFIQSVQDHFVPNKKFVVNFTDGVGYSTNFASFAVRNKVNPFASLYECLDLGDLQTVFCTTHPNLKRIAPVKHVYGTPMYFMYYHDNKLSNKHIVTSRIGLIWHYFVQVLCQTFPDLNNRLRYSYARPIKVDDPRLKPFHTDIGELKKALYLIKATTLIYIIFKVVAFIVIAY